MSEKSNSELVAEVKRLNALLYARPDRKCYDVIEAEGERLEARVVELEAEVSRLHETINVAGSQALYATPSTCPPSSMPPVRPEQLGLVVGGLIAEVTRLEGLEAVLKSLVFAWDELDRESDVPLFIALARAAMEGR